MTEGGRVLGVVLLGSWGGSVKLSKVSTEGEFGEVGPERSVGWIRNDS
jgi:hypothetical protein